MTQLELKSLSKSFGAYKVFDGLNLAAEPGEIVVIFGGSGTGKTILLRLIAGVEEPTSGLIEIEGNDVADIAPLLCPDAHIREAGLDDWINHFHLHVGERHHASADALATAELMLILFSRARQQHIDTPQALQERLSQWKRRLRAPSF